MAIVVKFVTVVIRIETIEKKYPGGIDSYMKDYPIDPSYRDLYLVGVIFMSTDYAEEFIEKLVNLGFSYIVNDEFDEISLVDQFAGLFLPCTWLENSIMSLFNREVKVSTCWLKGCTEKGVAAPCGECREQKPQETTQREHTLPFEELTRRYPGRFVNLTNAASAFILPGARGKKNRRSTRRQLSRNRGH